MFREELEMTEEELQASKSMNYFFLKFVAGEIDLNPSSAKDSKLAAIVKEEIRLFFCKITGKESIDPNIYTVFEEELTEGGYTENINQPEFRIRLAQSIVEVMGSLDTYIYNLYYFISNKAYGTNDEASSLLEFLALPELEDNHPEIERLTFNCFHITKDSAHIELSAQFPKKEAEKHNLYNTVIMAHYDLDGNLQEIDAYPGHNKSLYKLNENQRKIVEVFIECKQLKKPLLKQADYERRLAVLIEEHNSGSCRCDHDFSCFGEQYLNDSLEKEELFEKWRRVESSVKR
ncbi:hypothetical protein F6Y05_37420 [Bacillus megaterium]|nr:hypothetical protein [Priestia megaterium]